MDQSFHGIRKLHISPHPVTPEMIPSILLSEMIGHILCFLQLIGFSFCFVCTPFAHTGLACYFIQDLLVMLGTSFPYQSASQTVMDDPVDLKIRISSDRRSKVAVILRCSPKCPLHPVVYLACFMERRSSRLIKGSVGSPSISFRIFLDFQRCDFLHVICVPEYPDCG